MDELSASWNGREWCLRMEAPGELEELRARLHGLGLALDSAAAQWVQAPLAQCRLPAADAADFLLSLDPVPPSLSGWRAAALLVRRRLAARQYFPDFHTLDGRCHARWRLWLRGKRDLRWLKQTAELLNGQLGENGPAMLESFLHAAADALVRRCLQRDDFFEQTRRRCRQEPSLEAAWLASLLGSDSLVPLERDQLNQLLEPARQWLGQLSIEADQPPQRLCFRLLEPPGDLSAENQIDPQGASDDAEDHSSAWQTAAIDQPPAPAARRQANDTWPLVLQLQAMDAGGGMIDAAELWQSHGHAGGLLGSNMEYRRQLLQSQLHSAAEVWPLLAPLAAQAAPARMDLSATEAYRFMHEAAPLLRDQGFGVFLPEWTRQPQGELGLQLALRWSSEDGPGTAMPGAMGLDTLLEFDWRVAVGDEQLSVEQFERILDARAPLVRFAGRWMQVDLAAAEQAMQLLRDRPGGRGTLGEALRLAYASQTTGGLPIAGISAAGWLEDLLAQRPAENLNLLSQPGGFVGTLRPYQLRGLSWLVFLDRLGLGACLADDMGLGKTIQLIALLLSEREVATNVNASGAGSLRQPGSSGEREAEADATAPANPPANPQVNTQNTAQVNAPATAQVNAPATAQVNAPATAQVNAPATAQVNVQASAAENPRPEPTLLFAPTSVVSNWLREIERFAPSLRVLVHHGPLRLQDKALIDKVAEVDVVLTSYALAHRDRQMLQPIRWGRVVLDEAQKVKNPAAASSQAIAALSARRWVALTGTPIENRLAELWSIMNLLNRGLLGGPGDFRERFAVPIERQADRRRGEQLRQLIRPFVLRRLKADPQVAVDLPRKIESKVYCNLTVEQAGLYQKITDSMLGQIDSAAGIRRRGLILATLTRLKQVCDHPLLLDGPEAVKCAGEQAAGRSGKCKRLLDMLDELMDEGDCALIFTQYRQMGLLLERLINRQWPGQTQFLHGGTPPAMREQMVRKFQEPGSPVRIFLLSLRAGGLGLNLTAANHVFHFDRWWNPAVEQQATDRAHRIGQSRTVQVHKYVCTGTLEERIDRMLTEKLDLADRIVGGGEEWLTNLSTEQLRHTLRLTAEAIEDEG